MKPFQTFTAAECAAIRAPGWSSFQGWPLENKVATGRSTCRCCGQRIAKGETAKRVAIDLSVPVSHASWDGNGWQATQVWMHSSC